MGLTQPSLLLKDLSLTTVTLQLHFHTSVWGDSLQLQHLKKGRGRDIIRSSQGRRLTLLACFVVVPSPMEKNWGHSMKTGRHHGGHAVTRFWKDSMELEQRRQETWNWKTSKREQLTSSETHLEIWMRVTSARISQTMETTVSVRVIFLKQMLPTQPCQNVNKWGELSTLECHGSSLVWLS